MSVVYPPDEILLPALAYLRKDHRVLTRPLLLEGASSLGTHNDLAEILLEKDRTSRLKNLKKWFQVQPIEKAAELISNEEFSSQV
ncbi:MAG: hypothetical protein CFE32_21835 [Alphaproteobacteria bacterium PA3]|nr:MAG: hypothetical protein CFE32_21835 [Alphaproteobacteria bacterium PA3]